MRGIVLSTPLPELWDLFLLSVTIKLPPPDGLYDLSGLLMLANIQDIESPIPLNQFWSVMTYFLTRYNQMYIAKRKAKNGTVT